MRTRLMTALAATCIGLAGCTSAASAAPGERTETVATTTSGDVSGRQDGAVDAFLGIPYAAAPVGPLRWRPPQSVTPWSGIRAADEFGPSCAQATPEIFGPYQPEFLTEPPLSEDCLYLNVWRPRVAPPERPVMVWLHGGGFSSGSGSVPIYQGRPLAEKGAVVVTVNYRLGALGFLAHPDLSRESPDAVSGNYGLLDMIAALRWTQENIAAFGGDPHNITIAGQSAGAAAVNDLLISPLAANLFQRAIAQSGSGMGLPSPTLSQAEQNGLRLTQQVGAPGIEALRGMSAEQLLAATTGTFDLTANTSLPQYVPTVDGHVLPTARDDPAAAPTSAVPLLTGYTANEVLPSSEAVTPASFEATVRSRYGASADRILSLYPHDDVTSAGESQTLLGRDRYMSSLLHWADERSSRSTQPIYLYQFDHAYPIPDAGIYRAFHTSDVPYSLGTLNAPGRNFTFEDHRLSELMQLSWLSFMTSGDPTSPNGLSWRPSRTGVDEVMALSDDPGPKPGVSSEARLQALRDFVAGGGQLSLF